MCFDNSMRIAAPTRLLSALQSQSHLTRGQETNSEGHSRNVFKRPSPDFDDGIPVELTRHKRLDTGVYHPSSDMSSKLPDECLSRIFHFVSAPRDISACALVCHRWLHLQSMIQRRPPTKATAAIRDSFVEGHLTRTLEGRRATDLALSSISVALPPKGGLGKLEVRGTAEATEKMRLTSLGFHAIGKSCPGLTSLEIWNCPYVDSEALVSIAKGCPGLEKIDVMNCPRIGDKGLIALGKNCHRLSVVNISKCSSISSEGFLGFAEGCHSLTALSVADCPLVGSKGLSALMDGCRNLRKLKLEGRIAISDEGFKAILNSLHGVISLKICRLLTVGEEGMKTIGFVAGLKNLQVLCVTECPGFSSAALEAIGASCAHLKALSIAKCGTVGDSGLKSVLNGVAGLEILNLSHLPQVTQVGVKYILSKGQALSSIVVNACDGIIDKALTSSDLILSCPSLKKLRINNCIGMGNGSLAMVGRSTSSLENLDLTGLARAGDRGLAALVEGCGSTLSSINLTGCDKITDRAVMAICKHCGHSVKSLNLDGCSRITDKGLKAIAAMCTSLEDIDLSRCGVSDKGIQDLVVSLGPTLNSLSLAGCKGITDKSVREITSGCLSLWGLNLKNCPGLSKKAIKEVKLASLTSCVPTCLFVDT